MSIKLCRAIRMRYRGCALAFLALGKVSFVSELSAPCHVLKIAWGSFGEFQGCVKLEHFASDRVTYNSNIYAMF